MVSVNVNKTWWGQNYDWAEAGDEWSAPWGGAEAQWYGSLLPRIHRFLPAGEILEIACGYGRWTQFLKDQCDHLTAVDLSENCVAACRERFAGDDHLRFIANDGTTVPEVADASIDLAFSFDSLVHVDQATISAYLAEFRRVLKPEGVAFIHHSNYGAYAKRYAGIRSVPKLPGALRRMHLLEFHHMRDQGVSGESVAKAAKDAGLRCIGQEIIPWTTSRTMIDCISVIVPDESPVKRPNQVVHNREFNREGPYVKRIAPLYAPEIGS
jgi:ubiquinone/menaquinone biosynthesis C-methylase UbiE